MRNGNMKNDFSYIAARIGFLMILLFTVVMILDIVKRQNFENNTSRLVYSMENKEDCDGLYDIEEYIAYLKNAIETQDMDKFLRGCAIEERTKSYPFTYLASQNNGVFSYNTAYLPSAYYETYQPINMILITNEYMKQFEALRKDLYQDTKSADPKIKWKDTSVLLKRQQLSAENVKGSIAKAKRWSAEMIFEVAALLSVDNKDYMACFTVARYDDCFKLFKLQGNLLDWEKDVYATLVTDSEYEDVTDVVRLDDFVAEYEKAANLEGSKIDLGRNFSTDQPEQVNLPLNYYMVDQIYSPTAEAAINSFVKELQRNNPKKAMNYVNIEGDSLEEMLRREGDVMLQLSYIYKGLCDLPYAVNVGVSYNQLNFSSSNLQTMLDASAFHTISIHEVYNMYGEYEADAIPYNIHFHYNLKNYKMGFTMRQYEKGWQIYSFGTPRFGLAPGEVVDISELY